MPLLLTASSRSVRDYRIPIKTTPTVLVMAHCSLYLQDRCLLSRKPVLPWKMTPKLMVFTEPTVSMEPTVLVVPMVH